MRLLPILLLAAAPAAAQYTAVDTVEGAATIKGVVKYTKAAPAVATLTVSKDASSCGANVPDESWVVGKGGVLANVVVFLDRIEQGKKPPAAKVEMTNKDCRYVPHVVALAAGSELLVTNSDAMLHNTHSYSGTATVFNIALPMKGMKVTKKMDKLGPIEVKCDLHEWMRGWAYVAEHPYVAVTDANGAYTLTEVPPGKYTVRAWHEAAGETKGKVTVAAGATATLDLAY